MSEDRVNRRFKKVSEQVDAMSKQQEQEISSKISAIKENAAKKFAAIMGSGSS